MNRRIRSERELTINDTTVIIFGGGRSNTVCATILGVDKNEEDEVERIYLDRIVHHIDTYFAGWQASGAISTVLTKTIKQ